VDTLKIDRGFVRDIDTNAGDLAIVRSTMALADAFGLDVVAEGVETVAAAQTLLGLGCYRAQGFLLSGPQDSAAMEVLLASGAMPMDFSTGEDSPPGDASTSNNPGTRKSSSLSLNHSRIQRLK
jgi:predicted signal transduction protein with EAL and GGDEF domain